MKKLLPLTLLFFSFSAHAIFTEVGISYNYKKTAFDENNNNEQQATQSSVSFYIWDRIALELSYTNGLSVNKEKNYVGTNTNMRTTTVYTDAYGADLIFILAASKEAKIQPFIKGGAAQIKRKIVIQDENASPWEIVYTGLSPSYGVGIKFLLSQSFALRASYDVLQAPTSQNTKYDEATGRAGISWMF